jgi:hypothetical protein
VPREKLRGGHQNRERLRETANYQTGVRQIARMYRQIEAVFDQ